MATIAVEIPDDLLVRLKNGGSEPSEALRRAAAFVNASPIILLACVGQLDLLQRLGARRADPGGKIDLENLQ